jgi:hypothetical protein
MSDERDETRRYPAVGRPDDTMPGGRRAPADQTRPGGPPSDDRTRITGPPDDRTRISGPADDDWASSRVNPVWSGRAEVRTSQPGRSSYDTDWSTGPVPPQRDRWWMPILVGIIVLILLAALGWGIYLIVQNSGGSGTPGPAPTATTAPGNEPSASPSTETTAPSAEPTTTSPAPGPSTTEPTTAELTVPALRGLALADAQAALTRTGLKSRLIYRTSDAAPDTVIDSDPAEGQEVPPDTTVTLVVARNTTTTPAATATTGPANGIGGGD